jgi:hypothetical protein
MSGTSRPFSTGLAAMKPRCLRSTRLEHLLEAQKITVRVLHEELTAAKVHVPSPVQLLLGSQEYRNPLGPAFVVERVDLRHLDLKIDPSSKRLRQVARQPSAAGRLLDHELGAIAIEISEFLLRTVIENAKAEKLDVKAQAMLEIGAVELRNQLCHEMPRL